MSNADGVIIPRVEDDMGEGVKDPWPDCVETAKALEELHEDRHKTLQAVVDSFNLER